MHPPLSVRLTLHNWIGEPVDTIIRGKVARYLASNVHDGKVRAHTSKNRRRDHKGRAHDAEEGEEGKR